LRKVRLFFMVFGRSLLCAVRSLQGYHDN
jgi:hypothetical protein